MDPDRTTLFPTVRCPACGADFVDGVVYPVRDQVMTCLNDTLLISADCEAQKRLVARANTKVVR